MSIFNIKREFSSGWKILIIAICLCIGLTFSSLVVGVLYFVISGDVAYKILLILSSVLSFGLAAVLAALVLRNNDKTMSHLGFKRSGNGINPFVRYLLVIAFMLAILPAIELVSSWNAMYSFPESLKWLEEIIREAEASSSQAVEHALAGDGIGVLILNLLALALTPAVCEEMFFRGILQQHLVGITKKPVVGILLTAFIFSAIHMELSGLVPRFLLGIALGYIFYTSGSLWTSITAHFTNNAAVVFVAYFSETDVTETQDISSFGSPTWICLIIGGLVVAALIGWVIFGKRGRNTNEIPADSNMEITD